jgi:hypothetical protein
MNHYEFTGQVVGRAEKARPASLSMKRFTGGCLLMFLTGVASGCYTYTPVQTAATPGMVLVLPLNDQGRLTLGPSVGPSAETIEGTLTSRNDSSYVVSVNSVSYFNGGSNKWSGEPLTIGTTLVQNVQQRQFSRSRTWLVVGAAAAAFLTFALSRSIFSNSSPERQGNPPPPNGS